MRELGWAVEGLEISAYAARYAAKTFDLKVSVGDVESAMYPPDSFDAVFMGDVLEHLRDPLGSLGVIHTWVKPEGLLLAAVPSTVNLLSSRIGMRLYGMQRRFKTLRIPPYHLFEFSPRTLRAVLRQSGFRVLELRQSAVSLRRMGLRGTPVENLGKASLQVFAHITARLFNRGGDRLLAVARRSNA
jgi:SAM-dependent methyltransferase